MKLYLALIILTLCGGCYLTPEQFMDECLTSQQRLLDMETITRDVTDSLKESNIRYWLDWGTLLGAYRFAAPLPYDDDVDLGVWRPDYDSKKLALVESLRSKGYDIVNWEVHGHSDSIPQVHFKDNHSRAHLDLFLFEEMSGNKLRYSSEYWHQIARFAGHDGLGFPKSVVFDSAGNLSTVYLLKREYPAPKDFRAYFKRLYKEPDMLNNFQMAAVHSGGLCAEPAKVEDIKTHRNLLDKMFDHLEKIYQERFHRTDSRLY